MWSEDALEEEYNKDYFKKLIEFIDKEYSEKTIYPKKCEIFFKSLLII